MSRTFIITNNVWAFSHILPRKCWQNLTARLWFYDFFALDYETNVSSLCGKHILLYTTFRNSQCHIRKFDTQRTISKSIFFYRRAHLIYREKAENHSEMPYMGP